jgi:hypothetical protein
MRLTTQHCLPTNPPFPYATPCQLKETRANTMPPFLNNVLHFLILIYIPSNDVEMFFYSTQTHQHLMLFVLLMGAILRGVRWNLSVILICIPFMARDGEHFFICLLAIVLLLRTVCSVHLPIYSVGC